MLIIFQKVTVTAWPDALLCTVDYKYGQMEVGYKSGLVAQGSLGKMHEHGVGLPLSILGGTEHQTPSSCEVGI